MAFLTDTFTDSNGTQLQSHTGETGATWTLHPSYAGSALVRTNRIHGNSGTRGYYASGVPASADYDVEGVLRRLTSAGNAGLAGRMDTAANTMYLITWEAVSSGQFALYKINAGVIAAALGTFADTSTDTDRTVKLQMRGTAIKVFIDGVERISVTDSSITSAGRAGVRLLNGTGTTGTHIDSITASDVATTVERSAALSATASIATAGTFFTEFSRAASLSATASIQASAQRDVLRSASLSATGTVSTAGQRDLLRQATVSATGSIATAGQRDLQRAVSLSASGAVESAGEFWTIFERAVGLSATGAITSAPQRDLLRSASFTASGAVTVAGGVEGGVVTFERAASLSASAAIAATGVRVVERSASLSATGAVEAAGQRDLQRAVSFTATAGLASVGQRDLERAASFDATGTIQSAGLFWSILERQAEFAAAAEVAVSGLAQPPQDLEAAAAFMASGQIAVSGRVGGKRVPFHVQIETSNGRGSPETLVTGSYNL